MSKQTNNMASNFTDPISKLMYERFKECLPLGLFKIWFRVKDGSLEGLGDLLGYSDLDFREMVEFSELSRENGLLDLLTWEQKLHIRVEVRESSIGTSKFKTIRFGDTISVGDSPEVVIPGNTFSDWRNKTYRDQELMEIYILEYRNNYQLSHHIRNCTRLPVDIVQLLARRKYQRRYNFNDVEEMDESEANSEFFLRVDRNSSVDVAPHLTAFNRDFTEEEREDVFIEELRKRKEFEMVVASPNNKLRYWYHFPTTYKKIDPDAEGNLAIGPVQMKGYKKRITKDMIKKLCETIGGTEQRGHHILLQQLLEINEEWTDDVLRDNGINAFNRLTPEETLSLQTQANLTTKQRRIIGRILKHFNGGIQVLSAESEISKINWKNCHSEMIFKTLTYYVDKNGNEKLLEDIGHDEVMNWVKKNLKYFYCIPYDVLYDRLEYFRNLTDHKKFVSIGMVLDNDQSLELPLYIFINILGDHGGNEMKVVQLTTLRDGDGQSFSTCIGQFEEKESYFLFQNTLFPPINDSIEELNNLMLLVAEWGSINPGPGEEPVAFDFLFYPKHLFLETDNYYSLPSLLDLMINERGIEGVIYNTEFLLFRCSDIPRNCRFRNINIVCFSSGDIAYQMLLLSNRKNFSGSRCMKCKSKHNEWQDQSFDSDLYINLDFERIQEELNLSVEELRGVMLDELEYQQVEELHNELVEGAQMEAHRGGVTAGQSLILPAIEVKFNFTIPVLHIKLGLTLTLYNSFFNFIFENLEIESDEVRKQRLNFNTAKENYQVKCEQLVQLMNDNTISTMEPVRNKIIKLLKIKKEFEDRPLNNRAPTANQIRKYQEACQELERVEPEWNAKGYELNVEDIMQAGEEIDRFFEEKETAKDEEKEAKKNLSDAVKALQLARKNQFHKPVKEATETIMCKYGIITQAYHSHSLIGEHCHRLLMHRDDILYDIKGVWIAFTMDERNWEMFGDDTIDKIEEFISHMSDLLEALDYCCSFLSKQNYWYNDNEIDEFKSVAFYFGTIWREYLRKSVPPKLHMLEKHCHQFLYKWRNTGNFGEDPVERDHHDENKFNRMFCNIRNWEERKRLIRDRKSIYNNALIANTSNTIIEATSRKRSNDNNNNNDYEKRQKKAEEKIKLIRKVMIKTPNNSSQDTQQLI